MTHEDLAAFIEAATVPDAYEIALMRRHPGNLRISDDPVVLEFHIEHGRSLVEKVRSDVFSAIYELQRLRAGVVALEDLLKEAA